MLVYLFIEHYPNPYKPWIDTQLVQLLRAGHDVRIFAFGSYTSTIHDEVRQFNLQAKTTYFPATLRGLGRDGPRAIGRMLASPWRQARRAASAQRAVTSPKHKLLVAARALLMPVRSPDVCYIHNLVAGSALTFLRRLYPEARVCLYFHGGEVGGQPKVQGEAGVFAAVDAVITSTRFAAQQAIDRGCSPEKIAVLPLGFHLPSYIPSPTRTYRPEGTLRFVSVGRMSPEKGFMYALKAVKRLLDEGERRFQYTLVGTGIQFAELQAFAHAQGLDQVVRFAGEKTRAEVAAELEKADAFILPSVVTDVWAETQATVVQEALLMGCLTLTTAAGGVPEANAPVMARFSVPPVDVEALAGAMRHIISLDAREIARLGSEGRAFASARYDIGPLMERIMAHALGRLPANDESRLMRS